jgi:hypothetical protein
MDVDDAHLEKHTVCVLGRVVNKLLIFVYGSLVVPLGEKIIGGKEARSGRTELAAVAACGNEAGA